MDGAEATGTPPLPADEAGRLASFLRDGGRLAVLTGPGRAATRAVLEPALWAVPGLVVRAGNPLTTPLSLSRVLLQAGADPHADDEAAALMNGISTHAGGRSRAVLAIDDAHTLEPEALAVLARLPAPGVESALGVQLVFAGRPGLMDILAACGFAGLYDPAASLVLSLGDGGFDEEAAPLAVARPRAASSAPFVPPPPPPLVRPVRTQELPSPAPPRPFPTPVPPAPARVAVLPGVAAPDAAPRTPIAAAPRRRPLRAAAVAGTLIGAVAGLAGLWVSGKLPIAPPARFAAALPLAEPLPAEPPAVASAASPPAPVAASPVPAQAEASEPAPPAELPAPPPAPAAALPAPATPAMSELLPTLPPGTSDARLRRDFDAFLRRSGWNATARTPEAREALFRDYKEWLARNRAGPAPAVR